MWLYRPPHHKLAYRGRPRVVAIGPRAQAVLTGFWPADPGTTTSPRGGRSSVTPTRSAARKTPAVPVPRQAERRQAGGGERAAGRRSGTRRTATARPSTGGWSGRSRPDRHDVPEGRDGPNLPRSALAPEPAPARARDRGPPAVRAGGRPGGAGARRADVTQVYAERDLDLALRVASEMG